MWLRSLGSHVVAGSEVPSFLQTHRPSLQTYRPSFVTYRNVFGIDCIMIRLEPSRKNYIRFRTAFRERRLRDLEDTDSGREDPTRDPDQRRQYLRQYMGWFGRYWKTSAILIVLSLVMTVFDMTHPLFLRYILDDILLQDGLSDAARLHQLHLIAFAFLAVILVGQLVGIYKNYRTLELNTRIVLSLRRALYDRMLRLPLGKLTDMKIGGIISRLTGDVSMTTGLLQMGIVSPGVSLVRLSVALGILLYLNWRFALIALAVLPAAVLLSLLLAKRIRPIYRTIRDDASRVDGRVGESFGGIRVVRGFRSEALEARNHMIGRHGIIRKQLFAYHREMALWTVWGLLMAIVNLVAVWFGGALQIYGSASIGDIMAFQWYAMMLIGPVLNIVNSFSELQRSLAAMERVFEVLDSPVDKPDRPNAIDAPSHVQEIRFDHVDFSYHEDTPVIVDFDITIPGGSTVALVGRSGAGKTTITDLVARFQDPTRGRILLNGQDLRDLRLASYRELLGIVQQDVFLFDGTVRDNISYGSPLATDAQIIEAARRANAHAFIVELVDGYDTRIGERGVRLSGGQAQRLSIARALLADPQILILDEATSNLDSESEQLIRESIQELFAGRTTFVVAHRLSTVSHADIILVMDEGRIVEHGTHDELITHDGLYAEMVARQQEAMRC